jgi:hypothetical protein
MVDAMVPVVLGLNLDFFDCFAQLLVMSDQSKAEAFFQSFSSVVIESIRRSPPILFPASSIIVEIPAVESVDLHLRFPNVETFPN